ncbi:uncharacterized protein DUF3842 [Ruminiclostridium sufflavum DSM 19573]|uniref:Uncharacterized protein DUF3842 n=1 Tax=Ruminiclostridium sufflavum DSM 19573 TaxID=1121337 RepID=A0A318Y0U8_9FIRM|nr:DUF3842 family protein [Ruminiclostridium sufflavum]PYG84304.1 uncharacterized protein DUF3842 [Ruminiclostridium sufflavum DSM 19573]
MRIAVIDGQGGGIGKSIVEKLRRELPEGTEIIALGTNSLATSFMLKAGANEGASGENAIVYSASRVDIIIGMIGILVSNSMLGELTPSMAKAIAESPAKKVILPLNRCNIEIIGVDKSQPIPHLIDAAIKSIKEYMTR